MAVVSKKSCIFVGKTMKRLLAYILLWLPLAVCAEEYRLQFFDDRDGLSHWRTSHVVQDSTGMTWIATWNGLNRFDGNRFCCFKTHAGDSVLTPSDKFRYIKLNRDNNLFCVVEDSIFLFNTRTCRFDTITSAQRAEVQERLRIRHNPDFRLPTDRHLYLGDIDLRTIRYKYRDPAANYWLVEDHGLYIATPVHPRGQRVSHRESRSLTQLGNGEIWASEHLSHCVAVYDSLLRHTRTEDFGAPVYCIRQTSDAHIWLGTKPGALIELNGRQRRTYPELRNVYDLIEDPDQTLWVATYGFGLWRSEAASRNADGSRVFTQVPGTEQLYLRRLLPTSQGLLAATTTGLLQLRNGAVHIHQREAGKPCSLSSNAVMCLAVQNGRLYVGTEGGGLNSIPLADLTEGASRFAHIDKSDGLASDIIYEITPWNDTTLLLQGNSALTLLPTATGQPENFGSTFFQYADGRGLSFGEVPPLRLTDGRLLVAPHDGLLVLDAHDLRRDSTPVRIALSAVQISNGPINYAADTLSTITLTPDERSLGVWFAALDYRNCGAILYRTRLYRPGAESTPWTVASTNAEIQIPDLDPGTYMLEICSTNAYQQWQPNLRRLQITVQPAFIESTHGRFLLGLIVLITILTITISLLHMRALKLKRQEALNAYLEIQERLAQLSDSRQTSAANTPQPLPEVMVTGYLSQNEQFIQTLTAFMEANMGNSDIAVEDLQTATGMSRSSLNRKMHELFNLSPKDFLQEARIKHACSLLRQTDWTVKEIAYACGFSNPHYFATCFKNSVGVTPTDYR